MDRMCGILDALKNAIRNDKKEIAPVYSKKIDYGEREEVLSDLSDWKEFDRYETWGGREEHRVFASKVTIIPEWEGKEVLVSLNTGATNIWNTDNPQFIVYINGKMICGHDMNHNEVIITEKAKVGEVYDYRLYAYSNSAVKDDFLQLDAYSVNKDVEKLYYDMFVPYEIASLLKKDDDRRTKYCRLLNDTANMLDLRQVPSEAFYSSVKAADEYICGVLYSDKNKESDVIVHSIGHTHIDVAWKWPLRQTREKVLRSFATVLYQMDHYPEYKFMSSQPQLYQFVKEECPELFEKIRERVKEGRWETEGAMWLEADSNLSSGESLIRHIVYGKRFFNEEFGTGDNKVLWLPDVFGYSAAMPQILKKSGIDYFMTTKIGWNDKNKIPYDTMMWKGIDGTEILTYFITTRDYITDPETYTRSTSETTYNGRQNPNQIMGTWQRYQNKDINNEVLTCFGFGDGGGGPTPQMHEESRRMEYALPGCPKVKQTFSGDFFEGLAKRLEGKKVPKWTGELYLEYHRGTYTSMARNKKYNRLAEIKNQDAESLMVFANMEGKNVVYPRKDLRHIWEITLLNQFHDILPGSSIKDVYEVSKEQYEEILGWDKKNIEDTLSTIFEKKKNDKETQIVLFNNTSFDRKDTFVTEGRVNVYDNDVCLPCQFSKDGKTIFTPSVVPGHGYHVFRLENVENNLKGEDDGISSFSFDKKRRKLETPFYDVAFSDTWEISSLFDKTAQRNIIKEGCKGNEILAFEDRPKEYDAWNIDEYYVEKCYAVSDVAFADVVEEGKVRIVIRVKRNFLSSVISQDIIFYATSGRIDFETFIDWKESQILLKAAFPLELDMPKASFDIQFGNVERPTHRNTSWEQAKFEVCAHKWGDLSEAGYGVALLNDCKYGYDVNESVIRLTLLKSGIVPNPDADKECHYFKYSLYPHEGGFREGKVINEAYIFNCPMYEVRTDAVMEQHEKSYVTISKENVVVETIKPAEDNDDIIVRLYEDHGRRTRAELILNGVSGVFAECDMLENVQGEWKKFEGTATFEIKPYEIKTFRFSKNNK